MKTKQTEIDIDELKKEAVHSGLLEVLLLLSIGLLFTERAEVSISKQRKSNNVHN